MELPILPITILVSLLFIIIIVGIETIIFYKLLKQSEVRMAITNNMVCKLAESASLMADATMCCSKTVDN